MSTFSGMLNQAMEKRKIGVRALEREIIRSYGPDNMISRSLVSDYKLGKRAPTYEGTLMLANLLGLDKGRFLKATYELKTSLRQEAEYKRFQHFCEQNSIHDGTLKPLSELGTGRPKEEDKATLSEILTYVNEHYGTEYSSEDRIKHFSEDMERRLVAIEGLRRAFNREVNPSEDDRRLAFGEFYESTLEDMIDANFEIYKKIKDDPDFGALFQAVMFRRIGETYGEATA